MSTKVTVTKNVGMKTSTELRWKTDSNRVMEENKVMIQEIWKMSILYLKMSKKFCPHI